jgi:rubrerythrin
MRHAGGRYLFLTLTVVNPPDGLLKSTIRRMSKAFGQMMRDDRFFGVIGGYIRKIEITRNKTWHPHIHALIRVEESYFRSALYIKQEEWLQLWRDYYGDQNITQVDIRAIYDKNIENEDTQALTEKLFEDEETKNCSIEKAIFEDAVKIPEAHNMALGKATFEIAKYTTKDSEIIEYTLSQLQEWLEAVKGVRLWVSSRCLRINEADVENELIHTCNEESIDRCPTCGAVLQKIEWLWNGKKYEQSLEPLSWPITKKDYGLFKKQAHRRTKPAHQYGAGGPHHSAEK